MDTTPYMEWKTDPNLLAVKILKRIEEAEDYVSYSSLQERAEEIGVSLDLLDNALEKLQKRKKVKMRVKGDDILYKAKPRAKLKDPFAVSTWLRDNYPYPGKNGIPEFVMPFPEIDMSYIFLTPDEMKQYKANAKGMPLFMMNQRMKQRIKKAAE
jgi:DNA-binding transcriptional ArsR family regulator